MSIDTLLLLKRLLDSVTLNVGADDFEDAAQVVLVAKTELATALKDALAS